MICLCLICGVCSLLRMPFWVSHMTTSRGLTKLYQLLYSLNSPPLPQALLPRYRPSHWSLAMGIKHFERRKELRVWQEHLMQELRRSREISSKRLPIAPRYFWCVHPTASVCKEPRGLGCAHQRECIVRPWIPLVGIAGWAVAIEPV